MMTIELVSDNVAVKVIRTRIHYTFAVDLMHFSNDEPYFHNTLDKRLSGMRFSRPETTLLYLAVQTYWPEFRAGLVVYIG